MKYSKIKKVSQDRMIENTFETLFPLVSNFHSTDKTKIIRVIVLCKHLMEYFNFIPLLFINIVILTFVPLSLRLITLLTLFAFLVALDDPLFDIPDEEKRYLRFLSFRFPYHTKFIIKTIGALLFKRTSSRLIVEFFSILISIGYLKASLLEKLVIFLVGCLLSTIIVIAKNFAFTAFKKRVLIFKEKTIFTKYIKDPFSRGILRSFNYGFFIFESIFVLPVIIVIVVSNFFSSEVIRQICISLYPYMIIILIKMIMSFAPFPIKERRSNFYLTIRYRKFIPFGLLRLSTIYLIICIPVCLPFIIICSNFNNWLLNIVSVCGLLVITTELCMTSTLRIFHFKSKDIGRALSLKYQRDDVYLYFIYLIVPTILLRVINNLTKNNNSSSFLLIAIFLIFSSLNLLVALGGINNFKVRKFKQKF